MTDNNDLDNWLRERIDPLPPPPGTFEAIRRRARRRKVRKLAVSAGAALVVVAAAVTVPQVVNLPVKGGTPVAEGSHETTASVSPFSAGTSGGVGPEASASAKIELPKGNPVPPNFQPTSVTYVSPDIGFVIGQAGTPGHCATQWCTSVARTQDDGRSWTGLPAPLTGAPAGASGVGQIRFLEGLNGWAFGPELWATHDGGERWHQLDTHGRRVIDVETVGHRAFAVEAKCTGGGVNFAAHCTSFTLYSTVAAKDAWAPVGGSTSGLAGHSAALVFTGKQGYLLGPDGQLYTGPVDGSATWTSQGDLPCEPGPAQPDGTPSAALLAAGTSDNLYLACTSGGHVFASPDGGSTWQQTWAVPPGVVPTSIAATSAGTLLLATTSGIQVKPAGTNTWQPASLDGGAPAGGFSFVGMTTVSRGVALPANAGDGTVWVSRNGGLSWGPSPVQGP